MAWGWASRILQEADPTASPKVIRRRLYNKAWDFAMGSSERFHRVLAADPMVTGDKTYACSSALITGTMPRKDEGYDKNLFEGGDAEKRGGLMTLTPIFPLARVAATDEFRLTFEETIQREAKAVAGGRRSSYKLFCLSVLGGALGLTESIQIAQRLPSPSDVPLRIDTTVMIIPPPNHPHVDAYLVRSRHSTNISVVAIQVTCDTEHMDSYLGFVQNEIAGREMMQTLKKNFETFHLSVDFLWIYENSQLWARPNLQRRWEPVLRERRINRYHSPFIRHIVTETDVRLNHTEKKLCVFGFSGNAVDGCGEYALKMTPKKLVDCSHKLDLSS